MTSYPINGRELYRFTALNIWQLYFAVFQMCRNTEYSQLNRADRAQSRARSGNHNPRTHGLRLEMTARNSQKHEPWL
jgi:hypothetical protein